MYFKFILYEGIFIMLLLLIKLNMLMHILDSYSTINLFNPRNFFENHINKVEFTHLSLNLFCIKRSCLKAKVTSS